MSTFSGRQVKDQAHRSHGLIEFSNLRQDRGSLSSSQHTGEALPPGEQI